MFKVTINVRKGHFDFFNEKRCTVNQESKTFFVEDEPNIKFKFIDYLKNQLGDEGFSRTKGIVGFERHEVIYEFVPLSGTYIGKKKTRLEPSSYVDREYSGKFEPFDYHDIYICVIELSDQSESLVSFLQH